MEQIICYVGLTGSDDEDYLESFITSANKNYNLKDGMEFVEEFLGVGRGNGERMAFMLFRVSPRDTTILSRIKMAIVRCRENSDESEEIRSQCWKALSEFPRWWEDCLNNWSEDIPQYIKDKYPSTWYDSESD